MPDGIFIPPLLSQLELGGGWLSKCGPTHGKYDIKVGGV
jgi:hypothetical protein